MEEIAFITTSQVAKRLHVDTSTVRKWIAQGRITPAITTPGGHHRFALADVEALTQTGGKTA